MNEDYKGSTVLTTDVVQAMQSKNVIRDDNIPADLLKKLGVNGLKTMIVIINMIVEIGQQIF